MNRIDEIRERARFDYNLDVIRDGDDILAINDLLSRLDIAVDALREECACDLDAVVVCTACKALRKIRGEG